MKRMVTASVAGALLAMMITTGAASAAVPDNDLPEGAIALSDSVPQSFSQDTTEATVSTDDLGCGGGSGIDAATVWYTITPSTELSILISTEASTYAVGVNVYEVVADDANHVTCFAGNGFVTLQPGVLYYLHFVDIDGDGVNGGQLAVSLDAPPPPITIGLAIDPTASADSSGQITVSGTFSCDGRVEFGELYVQVRQPLGRFAIVGDTWLLIECNSETVSWSATVGAQNGLFGAGKATVSVQGFACGVASCTEIDESGTVRVRR